MDLIYTDANRQDVGILSNYTLDLAYGADENDFEVTVSIDNHVLRPNGMIYIEGTEYGGIVDDMTVSTGDSKIVYHGRTWHGVLNSKILEPNSGDDYLTVSGNANTVLATLITRMGLGDLFVANDADSDITITTYQFERYIAGYDGIKKMLSANSAKLVMTYIDGKMKLSAVPIVDYSQDDEFDSSQLNFTISQTINNVNHLICLGKGDLSDRQVIHLYVDENGAISDTQHYTDIAEITATYDYSSVESLDELRAGGVEKLLELANTSSLQLDLDACAIYDIGDIVGGKEQITGISIAKPITKKIVSIKNHQITIEHKL